MLHSPAFHRAAAIAWLTIGGAITLAWPDSVPWVSFMSLYAIVVSHWGSYQAARVEEKTDGA